MFPEKKIEPLTALRGAKKKGGIKDRPIFPLLTTQESFLSAATNLV